SLDGVVSQDADLQASAAPIRAPAALRLRSQRGQHRFPAKARFLPRTDHFQPDPRFLFDATHKRVAVSRFTRGARGYRAISRDAEFVHQFAEMPEGFRRFLENLFAKAVPHENALSQTQR